MSRKPLASTRVFVLMLLALVLASAAAGAMAGRKKGPALDKLMYAYSAAVRWGDFEGAWNLVDPKVRAEKPMTELDFSRYEQIEVTGYRDMGTQPGADGTVMRAIQINVVNRHTLSERQVRYTEVWRYDEKAKTWWVMALPDFWSTR